jgi:putative ATP-dependent endonuclease of OLD family
MQIRRLILSNFRGVKSGQIKFDGHTILIGGNSLGKSTVCEALDLLLGLDRLSRSNAINEHDFFRRTYIDEGGEPVKRGGTDEFENRIITSHFIGRSEQGRA